MTIRFIRRFYLILKLRGLRYFLDVLIFSLPQKVIRRAFILFEDHILHLGLLKWVIRIFISALFITWIVMSMLNSSWIKNIVILVSFIFILFILIILTRAIKQRRMLKEALSLINIIKEKETVQFTSISDLPITSDEKSHLEDMNRNNYETELGILDRDGRVLDIFGFLSFMSCVSENEFINKDRFRISIVVKDKKILIKKSYGKNRSSFIKESFMLSKLFSIANVPVIWELIPRECVIYMNLIIGRSLQEILANKGVIIRYSDIIKNPLYNNLSKSELNNTTEQIVGKRISESIDQSLLSSVDHQLDDAHESGVVGLYLKPGNILVQDRTNKPYLIDFHTAKFFRKKGFIYHLFRDLDRLKYNRKCGRNLMTEKTASNYLDNINSEWYAPVDFGYGLSKSAFWDIKSGMGRWEIFIKDYLPDLKAKKILDLGSNNGCLPIMMLKQGAKEVIGMELSKEFYQQSKVVHQIFQWRDMTQYDFKSINCNMYDILNHEFEGVDIVTSFCTLYYLSESQMGEVVNKASEISSKMVIQANTQAGSTWDPDKPIRASVEFLENLLKKNGFKNVEVKSPPFTTRPILIGSF